MRWLFKSVNQVHRWGAWFAALPSLVILGTGVTLALRQASSWIQPPVQKGTPGIPSLAIARAVEIAQTVPEAEVHDWTDVKSIEVKLAQGVLCLRVKNGFEVQLDGVSGKVLSAAPRRTTWLVTLHEGSYFHPWIRWGVFFPAGIFLLILSCTGIAMLLRPYLVRFFR